MRLLLKIAPIAAGLVLALTGCQDLSSPKSAPPALSAHASAGGRNSAAKVVQMLPVRRLTPGATVTTVTAAQVCTAGFVAKAGTVNATRAAEVFATYHVAAASRSLYQLDHLVPISLGGSNVQANLWPQLRATSVKKDDVENRLHNLVCAHKLALSSAQKAIRADWAVALTRYGTATALSYATKAAVKVPAAPAPVAAIHAPPTAAPTTHQARPAAAPTTTDDHGGATALCNDGTLSYSAHHQGTCSHHGGVAIFYR